MNLRGPGDLDWKMRRDALKEAFPYIMAFKAEKPLLSAKEAAATEMGQVSNRTTRTREAVEGGVKILQNHFVDGNWRGTGLR